MKLRSPRVFKLSEKFLQPYETQDVPWGPVGYITYKRTYARRLDDNNPDAGTEEWWQTCRRVIEGMFTMQKRHIKQIGVPWNDSQAQTTAKNAYDRLFNLKWTPPGRGLWMMGTDFVENKTAAGLFNCAFRSTKDIATKGGYLFQWMMDALMVGIGVGFDTLGAGTLTIKAPGSVYYTHEGLIDPVNEYCDIQESWYCKIADSREGWVEALRVLLNSFYYGYALPAFDYSLIRPEGSPIRGFGGTASGSGPLEDLFNSLIELYSPLIGEQITSTAIVDTQNLIGRCVVAGNVRRSAALAMGLPDDTQFLSLKDPTQVNEWTTELYPLTKQLQIDYMNSRELSEYPKEVDHDDVKLFMESYPESARIEQLEELIANHPLRHHRWGSNNSVDVSGVEDYKPFADLTVKNGEPGYIWLENARHYGRIKDGEKLDDTLVMGFNPCVEQQLEDAELCCVSGSTRITTKAGMPMIKDVVGKQVEIWNGRSWSKVTPFQAAKNKTLYRVALSDGSYLDVDAGHEWSARKPTARKFKRISTANLKVGMRLESFELEPIPKGIEETQAYTYGWYVGDGFIDGKRAIALVQQPEYSILPVLNGIEYPEQQPEGYSTPFKRVNISAHIPEHLRDILRNSNVGLPEEIFSWNASSLAKFFGGWIDTDGCLRKNLNSDHYIISSISEQKLRDAQILLRRLGVNHASLRQEKNMETNKGKRNKPLFTLLIPSYEAALVTPVLKIATRFQSRYKTNNAYTDSKPIDASRKQRIVSIEELEGAQDTYCFTEPERGMGVFGNCLTYQCLVETYPWLHDSYEDYLITLKIAYLYAKTVTLATTQWPETNAIMQKNRRIGLSMSGFVQAAYQRGFNTMYSWCDNAYAYVQGLDGTYSDWMCIPRSKRTTSIKPSGTVSKLNGSWPGIHHPESEYYIQRIRFSEDNDMLPALAEAGYHIERCVYSPRTMVVSFPVKEEGFIRGKKELSMWEQLEIAAQMQYYWADNSVSVTITFKDHEAASIPYALELYSSRLKAVSFLRYKETGYVQAPYESIDEETYLRTAVDTTIQRIDTSQQGIGERFCSNDSCEITFGE